MEMIIVQTFMAMTLSIIFAVLIFSVSKKSVISDPFSSPFECGFTPLKNSRSAYSLQFFLLALVFLVFDIEIIILFPVLLTKLNTALNVFWGLCAFVFILFIGLFVEWSQSSLEWMK